ncbi:spore protein [Paenibacillus agilis]|nr:spore protein [Paenibacillus agilis]
MSEDSKAQQQQDKENQAPKSRAGGNVGIDKKLNGPNRPST